MKKGVVFCTWIALAVCVMNGAAAQEGLYKVTNAENLASEKLVEKITSEFNPNFIKTISSVQQI